MKLKKCLLALSMLGLSTVSHAESFIEVVNKSASSVTTAANNVLGSGIRFDIGQLRINLDLGHAAFVTFSFVGKEAGWVNSFFGAGERSGFDNLAPFGANVFFSDNYATSRLLDFSFQAERSGPLLHNSNNFGTSGANFGVVLNSDRRSGSLLFDDGGAGPDRDYDDMVVNFRMTMQPVPEPSIAALMLGGLVLVAFMAARRRKV